MKKRRDNSTRAWALQITLSAALVSISAILLASTFKAAPSESDLSAPIAPAWAGGKDPTMAGPVSGRTLAIDAFTFDDTGSLNIARLNHTATLLPDGKVLVAAGWTVPNTALTSAELYDPASGSWAATGSLNTARFSHTATLLPDGKVLVTGGEDNEKAIASAELYDPASGSWTATDSLNTARFLHTATLLSNGKVLVAAGAPDIMGTDLTRAELYDPATGSWAATGNLNTARVAHRATLLPNGKVLVVGGEDGALNVAELYDPATESWTVTGSLNTALRSPTATLLPNGKVLAAGGANSSGTLPSAELYDPASESWTVTGSLKTARYLHTATLLPNGKVLVAGGKNNENSGASLASTELYDPVSGNWIATGNLNTERFLHTATLLPDGKVLVAGGLDFPDAVLTTAELGTSRPATLGNISTRVQVGTGDRVMIAGFIVLGSSSKNVLIRAAGPSLGDLGVPGVLADPRLQLYNTVKNIGINDDWQTTQFGGVITADQVAAIQDSGLAPGDPLEPAIITSLSPGSYTAILEGVNGATGVGLVEVYDLDASSGSLLANISTRGFVQTGDNAMIGGFIVVSQPTRVIIRAIGPSLTQVGVPDALANPQLELHNASSTVAQNNDWQTTQLGGIIVSDQAAEIQNSQLAPTNSAESAIIATLQPGSYTAIVRGVNSTTGNALVEVYALP